MIFRSPHHRLASFEADTQAHIHKENKVLFPAAIALAST